MGKKSIIWGTGGVFHDNITSVKFHEQRGTITICGITSNECISDELYGYKWYPKNEILQTREFDIIFVAAEEQHFEGILEEAGRYGIESYRLIKIELLKLYEIDFDAYMELLKDPPTILANNCWGGLTYHRLRLPFRSPLINMFENDDDYIRILMKPDHYLKQVPEFQQMQYDPILRRDYPVCTLGDIRLFCNHYRTYEEVKAKWLARMQRIDPDNLFVMMSTEDPEAAARFSEMDYKKKVCFTSFYPEAGGGVVYVDLVDNPKLKGIPFWRIVMGMANGAFPYYDVFRLLLYGELIRI